MGAAGATSREGVEEPASRVTCEPIRDPSVIDSEISLKPWGWVMSAMSITRAFGSAASPSRRSWHTSGTVRCRAGKEGDSCDPCHPWGRQLFGLGVPTGNTLRTQTPVRCSRCRAMCLRPRRLRGHRPAFRQRGHRSRVCSPQSSPSSQSRRVNSRRRSLYIVADSSLNIDIIVL